MQQIVAYLTAAERRAAKWRCGATSLKQKEPHSSSGSSASLARSEGASSAVVHAGRGRVAARAVKDLGEGAA